MNYLAHKIVIDVLPWKVFYFFILSVISYVYHMEGKKLIFFISQTHFHLEMLLSKRMLYLFLVIVQIWCAKKSLKTSFKCLSFKWFHFWMRFKNISMYFFFRNILTHFTAYFWKKIYLRNKMFMLIKKMQTSVLIIWFYFIKIST